MASPGIRLEVSRVGAEDGAPLVIDLPAAGADRKDLHATTYQDLTAHPWAGLPVELRLIATDATGQTGSSRPPAHHLAGTEVSPIRWRRRSSEQRKPAW